ncbi:SusC/RagA family TonB-linked outer membrane protein [Marivirga salinae]|uniref:SusC/RagA family TonB-linked outer membrane protein n=1 Tax=Marivirga salinarum TaxID=3059078 RepID=A0AA51N9M2_9BACT|nr:SusC/RagA family TonB-linked outer membrane protein [Marivirga sp. BDSF4-3]WMN11232.1 SusC/RagA family TonB-linked outer membrane protein [Marivirga sp. BDSF4-3]
MNHNYTKAKNGVPLGKRTISWRGLLTAFLMVFATFQLQAQERTVSGTVTDASTNETLPGTSVRIKGTSQGTTTSLDGEFKLEVSAEDVLVFSFIGYKKQEIEVGARSVIDVQMQEDISQLGEVVVVGYGQQEEKDVTGVVSTVKEESFNRGQIASPERLITGKIAGVDVTPGNTRAGGAGITIRGVGSINAQSQPLVVVDGVPINNDGSSGTRNANNFINPADIESVTVLKDASATAIYGSRGAAGVILYTTKSGKKGENTVTYDGSFTFSEILREPDFLSTQNFRNAVRQFSPQNENRLGESDTDWFNEVTRSTLSQNHNLSFSGATEKINYLVSVNHMDNKEVIKGDRNQVTRLSMRLKTTVLNDHLDITFNTKNALTNDEYKPNVVGTAVSFDPTRPVYDPEAEEFGGYYEWNESSIDPINPVSTIEQTQSIGENRRSFNSINFDLKIPGVEGLTLSATGSYDLRNGQNKVFEPFTLRNDNRDGYMQRSTNNAYTTTLFSTLNYNRSFGASDLDILGGYEFQEVFSETTGYEGINLTDDSKSFNDPTVIPREFIDLYRAFPITNQLQSYFGRVNYSYDDKYLLTVTGRMDGSTRFGFGNKYGFFPSAALGWRVIEEDFFQGLTGVFNDLKLRVGWGQTGNQNIGDYRYDKFYFLSDASATYQFGDEYIQLLRPTAVDPNIQWERLISTNIGVDFSLMKGRLSGSLDVYDKTTDQLLYNVPVPAATNVGDRVITNIGEMNNKGIELALNYIAIDNEKFGLDLNYNFTYNQNTIVKLDNEIDENSPGIQVGGITGDIGRTIQVLQVGKPISTFYSYNHLYDDAGNPLTGGTNSIYEDINNDEQINENDLQTQGVAIHPIFTNLSSNMRYGNFDLTFTLRAKIGGQTYNNTASANGWSGRLTEAQILNNLHESVIETGFQNRQLLSNYYIENSSFLKLDNLSIGYNFNQIEDFRLRLYGTVQNMLPISGYSGLDPEVQIDNNIYPPSTAFIFGINAKF